MFKCGSIPIDFNPKGCELEEHISPKVEVNTRMLSTFEKRKINLKHEPRGKFRGVNGWTSGDFIFVGQKTNKAGFFQFR